MRSENDQPPYLGPGLPVWPGVLDVVRATGQVDLPYCYLGYLQQQEAPALALRDRTPVYLFDPNQIGARPGYYRGRLVGSHTGIYGTLPLYFLGLLCCGAGPSRSSVSLSSSSLSGVSSSLSLSSQSLLSPSVVPSAHSSVLSLSSLSLSSLSLSSLSLLFSSAVPSVCSSSLSLSSLSSLPSSRISVSSRSPRGVSSSLLPSSLVSSLPRSSSPQASSPQSSLLRSSSPLLSSLPSSPRASSAISGPSVPSRGSSVSASSCSSSSLSSSSSSSQSGLEVLLRGLLSASSPSVSASGSPLLSSASPVPRVNSNCCPNSQPPTILYLTATSASGCACMEGTFTLTYNASFGHWENTAVTACLGSPYTVNMTCSPTGPGQYGFFLNWGGCFFTKPLTLNSCDPFNAYGTNISVSSTCCTGSINVTIYE